MEKIAYIYLIKLLLKHQSKCFNLAAKSDFYMFRNDELPFIIKELMENIINEVSKSYSSISSFQMNVSPKSLSSYKPFVDYSFNSCLLAYCLSKYVTSINPDNSHFSARSVQFPILSDFFAMHLTPQNRPNHSIRFCTPIKQSPNNIATVETCLCDTKAAMVESNYQKVAVLVVDEKLYQNCAKANIK